MFIIVPCVQAMFSISDDSPAPVVVVLSSIYSRHSPKRSPLMAGIASAAKQRLLLALPFFLVRTKTPTATLDGDERTVVTALGIPIIHSDKSLSNDKVTYDNEV